MDILNGELDVASAIIEEQDTNSLVAAGEQVLGLPEEMIDSATQIFE